MTRNVATAFLAVATLALASCGSTPATDNTAQPSGETITVEHKQGTTEVPLNPKNVVVFDYGSLDTLGVFGIDVAGVPKDSLPDALRHFDIDDVKPVGTLFEPDYEAINAINPELIIIGSRSAAAYPELSKHWPTIDLTADYNNYVADIEASTTILGKIFDREVEAQTAIADFREIVDEVRGLGANAGPGMIVSTSGGEVTVYGIDSRFGIIHSVLGVPEAVNEVEALPHGEAISFEMIRDTDPEWLFVNDRDAAIGESGLSAQAILDNELVHATEAWKKGQVVYLDAQRWYIIISGVENATEMFKEIGNALRG